MLYYLCYYLFINKILTKNKNMKFAKNIIVFYHENCLDGFTSCYIAWKNFKNKAEYIPLSHTEKDISPLTKKDIKVKDLKDKEVYFIDFCLKTKEEMKEIENISKKLIVLDHHQSAKDIICSVKDYLYGEKGESGAYLAQKYFFPKNKIPNLVKYVAIGDTYTFKNEKEERKILSYISTIDFDFKSFTKLEKDLEEKNKLNEIKKKGEVLNNQKEKFTNEISKNAKLVKFDKYKVYAVNANEKSLIGHKLAEKTDLFGIVFSFQDGNLSCSLRGVGKVDLSELAKKYGGGGHFNAASFKTKDEKFIMDFIKEFLK